MEHYNIMNRWAEYIDTLYNDKKQDKDIKDNEQWNYKETGGSRDIALRNVENIIDTKDNKCWGVLIDQLPKEKPNEFYGHIGRRGGMPYVWKH